MSFQPTTLAEAEGMVEQWRSAGRSMGVFLSGIRNTVPNRTANGATATMVGLTFLRASG